MKTFINILLRFLPCAFNATEMNRMQIGTTTKWFYESADLLATIIASAYFDAHAPLLRQHDRIEIVSGAGGTPLIDVLVVTSADNATPVTVTNGT